MQGLRENVKLSEYTTIKLGGAARYFIDCYSADKIKEALAFAGENNLMPYIIGGGSNIVFPDGGIDGIVIRNKILGIVFGEENAGYAAAVSGGGENWDEFVRLCIDNGLAGLECLSGIPGSVGATPVQNVGAYGQEVKDTIVSVNAIERETLKDIVFTNEECCFAYRESRFKKEDKDKYIITSVTFRLEQNGEPVIKYNELQNYLDSNPSFSSLPSGRERLTAVRDAVIGIRKRKSMVIDPADPDSVSCGSFFMNPVISIDRFGALQSKWTGLQIPNFSSADGVKIPAAWLIENSGFKKGYTKNGVGISSSHTLALVNRGGSAKALLELAEEITSAVEEKFGITLRKEPVVAG
jgi:UDP-N-acetylmuramate dehydrogenase